VINKPTHAVADANRNLQVTTKPEVTQASLGPTNLQDNTLLIKNITTKALQIFHQNIPRIKMEIQ
jgi:hypothetical protein